jgi:hypothetical protein
MLLPCLTQITGIKCSRCGGRMRHNAVAAYEPKQAGMQQQRLAAQPHGFAALAGT